MFVLKLGFFFFAVVMFLGWKLLYVVPVYFKMTALKKMWWIWQAMTITGSEFSNCMWSQTINAEEWKQSVFCSAHFIPTTFIKVSVLITKLERYSNSGHEEGKAIFVTRAHSQGHEPIQIWHVRNLWISGFFYVTFWLIGSIYDFWHAKKLFSLWWWSHWNKYSSHFFLQTMERQKKKNQTSS